jgi:UDP:flavonoid glycosyltransferase YjiC (YdhE family)
MHITVLAIGTRGDVQPLLALAVGLQQTGRHEVCFIAPDDFEALVREHGLDFSPLGMNARELLGMGDLGADLESGRNTLLWVWQILHGLWRLSRRGETGCALLLGHPIPWTCPHARLSQCCLSFASPG